MAILYPNPCCNEMCYIETAVYFKNVTSTACLGSLSPTWSGLSGLHISSVSPSSVILQSCFPMMTL